MTPLDDLKAAVQDAAGELRNGAAAADRLSLERPKKAGFGDYSTNAAMLLAPALGEPPRAVAERLGAALQQKLGGRVEKVEVAGPGFLNLFLTDSWYEAAVGEVLAAGDAFGAGSQYERIQVEFVSANPTGPLTAASGRHAAFGDALARILELAGNTVEREYYFNDSGGQVQRLGRSILARARGEEPPEDGYQGEYVAELAARIPDAAAKTPEELAAAGVEILMAGIRATLERYRVSFDRWFSVARLYEGEPSAWDAPARGSSPTSTPIPATAPCGCARQRSPATRRTARWCAPTASRRTSRPTSRITGTSSSAATTGSSTCSAPTTTTT